jgi:hypothetical protein
MRQVTVDMYGRGVTGRASRIGRCTRVVPTVSGHGPWKRDSLIEYSPLSSLPLRGRTG